MSLIKGGYTSVLMAILRISYLCGAECQLYKINVENDTAEFSSGLGFQKDNTTSTPETDG